MDQQMDHNDPDGHRRKFLGVSRNKQRTKTISLNHCYPTSDFPMKLDTDTQCMSSIHTYYMHHTLQSIPRQAHPLTYYYNLPLIQTRYAFSSSTTTTAVWTIL